MRNAKIVIAFLVFLSLILIILLGIARSERDRFSQLSIATVYYESPLERRAVSEFAKREKRSEESVRENRIPIEFILKEKNCVSLEIRKGILGSGEVICFDKDGKEVVEEYSSGE